MARYIWLLFGFLFSISSSVADAPLLAKIKKAAESGNPTAQKKLGQRYEQDFQFDQAEKWYRKAAIEGDTDALLSLARFYAGGKPKMSGKERIPANPKASIALYNLLCATGNAQAQFDLAVQYNVGKLLPRDPAKAYQLFRLSGNLGAKPHEDRLVLELSTEKIDEAERQRNTFRPMTFETALWVLIGAELELQSVIGTKEEMVVSISGVMFAAGETNIVEIAGLPLEFECLKVEPSVVTLGFKGRRLQLKNSD